MRIPKKKILEFIKESNAIESEYSQEAIQDSFVAWIYLNVRNEPLTLFDVLYVHKLLMHRLGPDIAGRLRSELKIDVRVGKRECPRYWEVANKLCGWIADIQKVEWTDETIKGMHIGFERVHPFPDGNGRTGRLIWLWQRQQAGLPFKIIKADTKEKDYYRWFE